MRLLLSTHQNFLKRNQRRNRRGLQVTSVSDDKTHEVSLFSTSPVLCKLERFKALQQTARHRDLAAVPVNWFILLETYIFLKKKQKRES